MTRRCCGTYRLQLRPEFGFRDAMQVLPYLRDLGVTHVYCSPCFQAARGSRHGYDVTDPGRINDELGGAEAYAEFCARMRELHLRQVLDIVPNHMCVSDPGNWRWWDVLARGRQSPWAPWFDIDWEGSERVLVPILGDRLERVLERAELRVDLQDGAAVLRYFDTVLPVAHDPEHTPDEIVRSTQMVEALRSLLDRQHYRLAFWRDADTRLNYRRFFDVTSLAGVRVEDPAVFDDTQRLAIDLVNGGQVDALRIDHIDGLRDPRQYLLRLRERTSGSAWLLVEKILGHDETLPDDWPVEGTTGYDFAALAGGLFVDPAGRSALDSLFTAMTGEAHDATATIDECKRLVCARIFRPEVARLSRELLVACRARASHPARSLGDCSEAVTAVLVAMPVYRTYAQGRGEHLSEQDRATLATALQRARAVSPSIAPDLLELMGSLVDGGAQDDTEIDFVLRLQQAGAAVTAKGVEDTAFYRCLSLVSLDEVGDSPLHWGTSVADFHLHNERAARRRPLSLLATSTHDSKRSEDVRMRLHVLSEFATLWADRARRWSARNARHKTGADPDGAAELLLYQTLLGGHPLDAGRATAYMEKAVREAKRRTAWTDPDAGYEAAVRTFTQRVIGDRAFGAELAEFAAPLVTLGRVNSLALTLAKLTSPGVPDIYQGTDLWDLSLVDPDNRRPVDFEARRRALGAAGEHQTLVGWNADGGDAKLALIHRALGVRARHGDTFAPQSAYRPLMPRGAREAHVVAFVRGDDVISVVPRLVGALNGWSARYRPMWRDTALRLPEGRWRNVLGSSEHSADVMLGDLLGDFPVALLERVAA